MSPQWKALQAAKAPPVGSALKERQKSAYNVDSISNPQASRSASGIYLEFLFRRAHSKTGGPDVLIRAKLELLRNLLEGGHEVGITGPMGSGLPQFGFPRRFAIDLVVLNKNGGLPVFLGYRVGEPCQSRGNSSFLFYVDFV